MDDFEVETPKDLGRIRTLALEGGNSVTFKCSDPYGFWTIHLEKGQVPHSLTGQYTTYEYAEKEMRAYLRSKDRAVAPVVQPEVLFETAPTPPVKTVMKTKLKTA